MHISLCPTPCLLLDMERLHKNCTAMSRRLHTLGVRLRPHGKTCKNIDVARFCMENPQGPLAVSTLAEAEYFAAQGVNDLCYAVGIVPQKLERVLALRRKGIQLSVILDSMQAARLLVDVARAQGHSFAVLLEIDCDGHRSGLRPTDDALVPLAAFLAEQGQELLGVLTHAGSAYELHAPTPADFAALAAQECAAVRQAADVLRAAGHACPVLSVGSTPTARFGQDFSGITEVRAGVYMFMDLVMAGLGVCTYADIALSVLCTVLGQQHNGDLIVDAGWLALSRDTGLAGHFDREGYGLVCTAEGTLLPGLRVADCNQEHGIIRAEHGPCPALPVGSLLRILPVHACATAAAHARYYCVSHDRVTATWTRCSGW